jgi:hypothetical protein
MEFRILGPLEILDEGRKVSLAGAKQRALLGLLVLRANQTLGTDRLIDARSRRKARDSNCSMRSPRSCAIRRTISQL